MIYLKGYKNMINSEKELEDYICEHQENFIKKLKTIYNIKEKINFVGRQVYIGEHNIADLIYSYNTKEELPDGNETITKNFIIVELKFRKLETKDLSQITRHMTTLQEKLYDEKILEMEVYGVLVGFDLDDNMQEIQMYLDNIAVDEHIKFISISSYIIFNFPSYKHKEQYIENLKLDERIIDAIYE